MDKHIVRKLKDRRESGLRDLYYAYGHVIYGKFYNLTQDPSKSQALLWDTFIYAWDHIEEYNYAQGGLYTWLNTIIKNSILNEQVLANISKDKEGEEEYRFRSKMNRDFVVEYLIEIDTFLKRLGYDRKVILDKLLLQGNSLKSISDDFSLSEESIRANLKEAIDVVRKEVVSEKNQFFGVFILMHLLNSALWN